MSRIRIMHVVRPSDGGIKKHIITLIDRSDRKNFEHMVACPPGATADSFKEKGIPTFVLPLKGELNFASDVATVKILAALFRENRVEIAHAHGYKAGLVGRVAAVLSGVPAMVMTVHNSIFASWTSPWKNFIYAAGDRILSCFTDRIIAVSGALAGEIVGREGVSPKKVIVIYNGISHDDFCFPPDRRFLEKTTGIPCGDRVVGTVARLAPQKGVGDFIKAAAVLSRSLSGVSFLVVGDGPLRAELERQSKNLSLQGRLFFAGERGDIARIMPCLDVFVLSSVSEGLPLALLEAMAYCLPVVATRVGGIPEVISDGVNGLLVDPGDVAGLARSVDTLLRNRGKSRKIGAEGKNKLLEAFTDVKMTRATERVYSDLIYGGCIP
ncbi:MAG: glycosyltransferase [Bacillota bacterium]